MKRFLIFALLFASGLLLLVKLQGGVSKAPDWTGTPSDPGDLDKQLIGIPDNGEPGGQGTGQATDGANGSQAPEGGGPTASLGVSGRITDTFYPKGGGDAIYTFVAEDSETNADGAIDFFAVRLEYFNKGVLTAARGRASLVSQPGTLAPSIQGDSVSLEDVEMKLESGHALAPMTLTGTRLQGNLPKQTFVLEGATSPGGEKSRPTVTSPRFHFEAAKLDLDGVVQRLDIIGDAVGLVFDDEGREVYRLTGDSIRIRNTGEDLAAIDPKKVPSPFEIEIDGNAKLAMVGHVDLPSATLSSNKLTLIGEHLPTGELSLSEILVDGTGVLAFGASTFTGSSFDFAFDEHGEAGSITVDGRPHVLFDLAAHSKGSKATPPLELNCNGPLTVSLDKYGTFTTDSLTTLAWAETLLVAQTGIHGSMNEQATRLSVEATGGVTLDGKDEVGQLHFSTETLLLDYAEEGEAEREVLLTSLGAAKFSVDGAGPKLGLHAEGQAGGSLLFALIGDKWSIPEAHDIALTLVDQEGELNARAKDLRGFDPAAKRFDARGDVSFDFIRNGEAGSGSGDVVVMQGLDSLLIEGAGSIPAEFTFAGANISAPRISREGDQLEATGGVSADFATESGQFVFTSNTLSVRGLPSSEQLLGRHLTPEEVDALIEGGLSFEAKGMVSGSATVGEELLYLECDSIAVEQALLDSGQAQVVITANAVRSATWQSEQHLEDELKRRVWSLSAGKLTATATELLQPEAKELAPTERASLGLEVDLNILAEGGVTVVEEVGGFQGSGESLRLINSGDDFFVRLDGGTEKAQVAGPLPGKMGATYSGTVLWLEATEETIDAVEADFAILGLSFMDADNAKPLHIKCAKLEGVPGTLQLDGRVMISAATKDAPNLLLTSKHATFTDTLLPDSGTEATDLPFDVSFLAHGDVRLRQGAEFELYGTDLIVEHGGSLIRIAGRPASVSYAGVCATSSWVEFDPVLMAFECGRGRLSMDPALLALLGGSDDEEVAEEDTETDGTKEQHPEPKL